MNRAFKEIGYEVEEVIGYSKERRLLINKIKTMIEEGEKFEFLYAESLTIPIPIADPHHLPLRPLQDYSFFRYLNKHSVPIGLFYRDIYWRVEELKRNTSLIKYIPRQLFYWLEWYGLCNSVDHLFLPTESMVDYLPTNWANENLSALYPGCKIDTLESNRANLESNNKIEALYIGGVTPPYYNLRPLINVVNQSEGVRLTLCCRKNEWDDQFQYYSDLSLDKINIIHAGITEIGSIYNRSDVVLEARPPKSYFKKTLPIKIIEAIGYEVPIILLDGSESAKFVKDQGSGWVVQTLDEIVDLLQDLRNNRIKLKAKINGIKKIKAEHTWVARAREASNVLKKINSNNRYHI